MGVDFYNCEYCEEVFADCGEFIECDCGRHWCSRECAEKDGYAITEFDTFEKCTCNYCRNEDAEDYVLLDFALSLLGLTRKELVGKLYIKVEKLYGEDS